jgi:hypothetical protein
VTKLYVLCYIDAMVYKLYYLLMLQFYTDFMSVSFNCTAREHHQLKS